MLGLWAETALEVGGLFSWRVLVPWGVQGFRPRGSLEGGLVPRVNSWHGLLDEVLLTQQYIPEAHMSPRECGEAD